MDTTREDRAAKTADAAVKNLNELIEYKVVGAEASLVVSALIGIIQELIEINRTLKLLAAQHGAVVEGPGKEEPNVQGT